MAKRRYQATPASTVVDQATVERTLGLPPGPVLSVPIARNFTFYYGGWDISTIRVSAACRHLLWPESTQRWLDGMTWRAEPGYYEMSMILPAGSNRDWMAAVRSAPGGDWQAAPVSVALISVLLQLSIYRIDPLRDAICLCSELLPVEEVTRLAEGLQGADWQQLMPVDELSRQLSIEMFRQMPQHIRTSITVEEGKVFLKPMAEQNTPPGVGMLITKKVK